MIRESEPEYEYIKGLGWVIKPPTQVFFVHDRSGKKIKITKRKPEEGERYIVASRADSRRLTSDGNFNEDVIRIHVSHFFFGEFRKFKIPEYAHAVYGVMEEVDD